MISFNSFRNPYRPAGRRLRVKKFIALILAAALAFLGIPSALADGIDPDLIAAAQADGELIVYGSCE